ncbi:MAG: hypothetical protein LBR19_04115 [Bifidobacteriaceae bacterium]|jgi:acyl-CoA reductase-like NAD-dependent aldehyde dehydrogenase|nr:hypothetical protein [Bifidobacteriaceae bacterium]
MKTTPIKLVAALGAGLLGLAALAGCGGSSGSEEEFCKVVTSEDFQDVDDDDADAMVSALKDLKNAAPSDLKSDVETVLKAFEAYSKIDQDDADALAEWESDMGGDTDFLDAYGNVDDAITACEADE